MTPHRVVLIGPPGVGKGTQAELMKSRLGLVHLSSGEIFRTEMQAETDLGLLAKRYMDEGRLVPNGVTIQMMAKRLRKDNVRHQGFILDGYPRTVRQAEALDEDLKEMEQSLTSVICLTAPEDVVVSRLAGRGRGDDDEETVKRRMLVFYEETEPVISYYRSKGILREIDANRSVDDVFCGIKAALES